MINSPHFYAFAKYELITEFLLNYNIVTNLTLCHLDIYLVVSMLG